MKGRKRIVTCITVFFLAMLVASFGHAAEPKVIKIGTVNGLTGPLSIPCGAFIRGFDFFADQIREQGGIKVGDEHYIFEFIHEDSKGSAEGASTAARKLVTQDKVKFIIGAILESEIAAIYQVTAPAGVLYGTANINIPGHPADVSSDKPLFVRFAVNPDDSQPIDLDYVLKTYPAAKTIAISAPDIGYEPMIEQLKTQAQERGMSIVRVEKWSWGTTDFIPTFTRISGFKPDIIFSMNSGQAADQLVAARQVGLKGPFIANSPLGADVYIAVAQDPGILTDVIVNSPDITKLNPEMNDLMNRWNKKYPRDPFISDCIHANDMPRILAQAMIVGKSIEPAKVMQTLEKMTPKGSLALNFGKGYMGGKKRFGVDRVLYRPIPITRIMNGKTEFVGFFSPLEE
jgi:branched-chain amino acid transport system substrate-binding protein